MAVLIVSVLITHKDNEYYHIIASKAVKEN
jgi:hypothetical protein